MKELIIISNKFNSFLDYRVKGIGDLINIWLDIIAKLLNYQYKLSGHLSLVNEEVSVLIEINGCSRMFILDKNFPDHKKIMVLTCPFTIRKHIIQNDEINYPLKVKFKDKIITHQYLALIRTAFNYIFEKNMPIADAIIETIADNQSILESEDEGEISIFLNEIFIYILSFDYGYVRYDFDLDNSSESKVSGKYIHPTYHLDLFLDKRSTLKVGLPHKYGFQELKDLLDSSVDCKFLESK